MKNLLNHTIVLLTVLAALQSFGQNMIIVPDDQPTIQEGINSATDGDTVLVSPGTYQETINFNGKNIVLGSMYLTSGEESFISQTIIDGGMNGPVIVLENGETNEASIVGFTITGASQSSVSNYRGGIICNGASPVIKMNILKGISGYSAQYTGAIICNNSTAQIHENLIDGNSFGFSSYSGGIIVINSNVQILRNMIQETFGGYVFDGGGIVCLNSEAQIKGNLIRNNYVDYMDAGLYIDKSWVHSENNTIVNHDAGILCVDSCDVIISTSIIFQNSESTSIYEDGQGNSITAYYSCIEGGFPGNGNISDDPLFTDPDNFDFTLTASSPCIDAPNFFHPMDPDGTLPDMGAFFYDQSTGIFSMPMTQAIKVYPNPMQEMARIEFNNPENKSYQFRLFDNTGKLVKAVNNIITSSLIMDRNGLESGVYHFALSDGKEVLGYGKILAE